MTSTLPAAVRAAAAAYGDHPAVVDGDVVLSFSGLHEAVRTAARSYVALGVEPGDRVAVWAPNSWAWEVAALAVSYAGGTLVPLNTRYKGHEVVDILARTGATLLVVDDGFLDRHQVQEVIAAAAEEAGSELGAEADLVPGLPALRAIVQVGEREVEGTTRWRTFDDLAPTVPDDVVEGRADAVSPDDIADIMFTSGTTGRSKGVLTAHRQTIAAADVWGRTGQVSQADRYLLVNPYFHSFGYKAGIVVSVLTGCTAYPQATFDVDEALRLIAEERITVLPGAPAIFHSLFAAPALATTDLSSLRLAVTGAATVPVALVERMQTELSFDTVLTAFGMTECVVATMCRPGDPDELVASTCGPAVHGLELQITDPETGEVKGPGEEGEVRFRGPMVMLGYLDDPAATAEAIDEDGWLHTGDVGRVDDNGYLKITDRLKDMYISGGFNVYPAEVEQTLARLDGVADSAVIGVPDDRMGEVGKVYVVRREGATLTADDVTAFAKERLANYKVPREVVFVDSLPRNLAGKVLKNELRN
jgi:acyl-CoA synthetase (AMP-forming)/AMP-acid ligase II